MSLSIFDFMHTTLILNASWAMVIAGVTDEI